VSILISGLNGIFDHYVYDLGDSSTCTFFSESKCQYSLAPVPSKVNKEQSAMHTFVSEKPNANIHYLQSQAKAIKSKAKCQSSLGL
jgi:hypothetical protein